MSVGMKDACLHVLLIDSQITATRSYGYGVGTKNEKNVHER